jgi:large subunit ribosomal protein L13
VQGGWRSRHQAMAVDDGNPRDLQGVFVMTRTYSPKAAEIERDWFIVDAAGQTLGRLSAVVARVLQGKHKPSYVPHLDSGDFVIVVNAEKAVLTGNKEDE